MDVECYYANARNLYNKLDELRLLITLEDYDLIAITESWTNLTAKHFHKIFNINGYHYYVL